MVRPLRRELSPGPGSGRVVKSGERKRTVFYCKGGYERSPAVRRQLEKVSVGGAKAPDASLKLTECRPLLQSGLPLRGPVAL